MYIIAEAKTDTRFVHTFFIILQELSILINNYLHLPNCSALLPTGAVKKRLTQIFLRQSFFLFDYLSKESTLAMNRLFSASEGMRKPFLGETEKSSTAGPSMRQLRLNCCEK